MLSVLNIAVIAIAGMLTGNELAIAAFIHPALYSLPEDAHRRSAAAVARILGRTMPFWYGFVLLLSAADAFAWWRFAARSARWIAASSVLWAVIVLFTVTLLVPINNRIASGETSTPFSIWMADRKRWDRLHRWRVLLLLIAFTMLTVGILCPNL